MMHKPNSRLLDRKAELWKPSNDRWACGALVLFFTTPLSSSKRLGSLLAVSDRQPEAEGNHRTIAHYLFLPRLPCRKLWKKLWEGPSGLPLRPEQMGKPRFQRVSKLDGCLPVVTSEVSLFRRSRRFTGFWINLRFHVQALHNIRYARFEDCQVGSCYSRSNLKRAAEVMHTWHIN